MALLIYLMSVVNGVKFVAGLVTLATLVFYVVSGLFIMDTYSGTTKEKVIAHKAANRHSVALFFIMLGVCIFVPDSKTIAAIYVVPKLVNNERVGAVVDNGMDALVNLTEEWAKDLVPKAADE